MNMLKQSDAVFWEETSNIYFNILICRIYMGRVFNGHNRFLFYSFSVHSLYKRQIAISAPYNIDVCSRESDQNIYRIPVYTYKPAISEVRKQDNFISKLCRQTIEGTHGRYNCN